MPVSRRDIPAPGFVKVSGKRPPQDGEWLVQYGNGLVDEQPRTRAQMKWVWAGFEPHAWDIVAVRRVG
jgi:hypothetical protein